MELTVFDRAVIVALRDLPTDQFDGLIAKFRPWYSTPEDRAWLDGRIAELREYVRTTARDDTPPP